MGSGPFQYGATTGTNAASFGDSYAPINPTSMGAVNSGAVSTYTVQNGDSLQSIASALWGDASLWYLIADANGLSGGAPIATGVTLSIPSKVVNVHNSASTFTVYDASKAMGALQPSVQAAAPPPSN